MADYAYIAETQHYAATVKDDAEDRITVEIGDSKQAAAFYPQAKLMRWDNEVNVSVRLVDDATAEQAVIAQDKGVVTWEKSGVIARFYEHPDGGFELEVILKERPKSNVFTFSLQTKGLRFFFQAPLTDEEIKEGCHRPDHIVGSYAVYHAEARGMNTGKLYRAGKAFHIYRPHAEDANGDGIWADLHIDAEAGLMTIALDGKWLDAAVYPVVIDPNFGYITEGGTSYNPAADNLYGYPAAAGSGCGSLRRIYAYLKQGMGGAANMKGVCVLDSSEEIITDGISGTPGAIGAGDSWVAATHGTATTGPRLVEGTTYVLCMIVDVQAVGYYDDGGAGTGHYDGSNSYASPQNPNPFNTNSRCYSIYAEANNYQNIGLADTIALADDIEAAQRIDIAVTDDIALVDAESLYVSVPVTDVFVMTDAGSFRKSLLTINVSMGGGGCSGVITISMPVG